MARFSIFGRRIRAVHILGLALAAAAVGAAARPASAEVPAWTGFKLDISPSARLLHALDMKNDGSIPSSTYYGVQYDESCDNPLIRIQARNKPSILLTNVANSSAPITSFSLAINGTGAWAFGQGDSAQDNFTGYVKNTKYTDNGVQITSSSVSADKKTLTVNFTGLDPGKMAVFTIDLDSTDPNGFMYPDYRMVLFGAPEGNGPPTAAATVSATFTNGTPAPNSKTLTKDFEQMETRPEFMQARVRPYLVTDKMEVTHLQIPEPTAAILGLLGVAALALRSRRVR
jgi:MYXO-CTERM domain-containing protein